VNFFWANAGKAVKEKISIKINVMEWKYFIVFLNYKVLFFVWMK